MDERRKLTNKELIRFRKSKAVRDLALAEEHSRTHTATAVLRRLTASEPVGDRGSIHWPASPEEVERQRQLEDTNSRRMQNLHRKPQEPSKAEPATLVAAPPVEPLQARREEAGGPSDWQAWLRD